MTQDLLRCLQGSCIRPMVSMARRSSHTVSARRRISSDSLSLPLMRKACSKSIGKTQSAFSTAQTGTKSTTTSPSGEALMTRLATKDSSSYSSHATIYMRSSGQLVTRSLKSASLIGKRRWNTSPTCASSTTLTSSPSTRSSSKIIVSKGSPASSQCRSIKRSQPGWTRVT